MSPEAQSIAIAEACGWSNLQYSDHKPLGKAQLVGRHPDGSAQNLLLVPDYLNDLNAMHEAKNMLTEHQWDEYERALRLVCDACSYYEAGKELLHATAAQQAKAFLKALNLWEASK